VKTTFLPANEAKDLFGKAETINQDIHDYQLTLSQYSEESQGYKRLIHLRDGLSLLIRNYDLEELLVEELECKISSSELEFAFNLSGSLQGSNLPFPDHSFLYFGEIQPTRLVKEWQPRQRVLKVDLHLTKSPEQKDFSPQQLALISPNLRNLILNLNQEVDLDLGNVTPKLKLIIQQILNCPYSGQLEKIYLESKALELIVIQSARVSDDDLSHQQFHSLKPRDIDCIYQAREILTQKLCNPPSLLDLAHQVGLNDCTLKRGFRTCFGITVFGYLRQQRLNQARELLLESDLNIAQVASAVGYSHAGYFASAFKREFGVTPKGLRQG
jgi:AraC family transcriptional activator of pyochelin receptor